MTDLLTISELARTLGIPECRTRRLVDRSGVKIARLSHGVRLIPIELVPTLRDHLAVSRKGA